eukprot:1176648-Prorocentrum_minimum.AAC.1
MSVWTPRREGGREGGREGEDVWSSEGAQGPQHRRQTANQGVHRTIRGRRPRDPTLNCKRKTKGVA